MAAIHYDIIELIQYFSLIDLGFQFCAKFTQCSTQMHILNFHK